ncbi:armadillo-type protein [Phakopsora pachyrhizi]|uniref:Pumilio homology domain family member 3 n=1 Tax=Phakopsora pachyrhizi TaxID=170000 RepID=A0AAV0BL35_PHAPC|nr:armadillo-type protein [Phakopsora pachyrhizi]CAH7686825.1 armadillo-type protein [Phakopsora pachyrhizi]
MTTPRTPTAGPGAIGDRQGGARRNSWEPWTTEIDNDPNQIESDAPHSIKIAAARRASEFSVVRNVGTGSANSRVGASALARHRLSGNTTLAVPELDVSPNISALRRASQPALAAFPPSESLTASMTNISAGRDPTRSYRASFNAGAPNSAVRANGLAAHRPSLPAPYGTSPLPTHKEGWNPYYFRPSGASQDSPSALIHSSHETPTALELSAATAYGQGYDYRRDSGYGPSPPIVSNSDTRRGSTISQVPAAGYGLNNLRRTQSAWHIHEAFANSPQVRHSSLSYFPAGAPNGVSASGYGLGAPNGFTSQVGGYNPNLMSMDGMFGDPMLSQQQQHQLLVEARRQSINRPSLDFGYNALQYPNSYGIHPGLVTNAMGMNPGTLGGVGIGSVPVPQRNRPVSHKSSFESNRVTRSAILEEFRSNKHRRWDLKDMVGHIVEFAGDQLGSRHIQSKLDTATSEEKELVFKEIYPNVLQLSMDVFANYVVQKFFEQGNQNQKTQLAQSLRGHVLQLSLQMYGCRVVQKALEFVLVDQQHALIKELEGEVIQCAKDQNANHVLQRSLERIEPRMNRFISKAFTGQAYALATHPYGCRVLQRVFEHMPDDQTRPLLDELHRFSNNLMTDQYGNYVAQWIITDGKKEDAASLLTKVRGQVLVLSKHKFASNVVEKAILKSTEEEMKEMIEEILTPRPDGSSTIGVMLKDAFANFPLQKFLQAAKEPQRAKLFEEVGEQLTQMKKYSLSYGKYLVAIEKLVNNERANAQFNLNVSLSNTAMALSPVPPITSSAPQIAV